MPEDSVPPKEDPHEEEPPYTYECVDCGNRIKAESQPGDCPECSAKMRDISKPSER